jgi:hypothetical protein
VSEVTHVDNGFTIVNDRPPFTYYYKEVTPVITPDKFNIGFGGVSCRRDIDWVTGAYGMDIGECYYYNYNNKMICITRLCPLDYQLRQCFWLITV